MKKIFFFLSLLMTGWQYTSAQQTEISVKLSNYNFPEIYLATFEGGEPHYLDTIRMNTDSLFIISSDTLLEEGIYLLLVQPRKQALQLLINADEQKFKLFANAADLGAEEVRFENAPQNDRYYEYLRYANKQRSEQNKLYKELETAEGSARKKTEKKLNEVTAGIYKHQEKLMKKYPGSQFDLLLRLDHEPLVPDFNGTDEEIHEQGLRFRKKHFFDGVPMTDPRIVYSPLFYNKTNFFLEKLTPGNPDSVFIAIQQIFDLIRPSDKNFSLYFTYLMNKYETPRIVGQDAVFVKLADQYLEQDSVPGISEDDKKAWLSKANKLRPVLIGMPAPDVTLQLRDGSPFRIYDVDADYTVLVFWRPGCGHCKKATPVLKALYEKYKNESVQIVGVCTQHGDGIEDCWKYVDEHGLGDWIQAVDRFHRSQFMQKYNAQRTPKIYILDRDKKIVIKDIGAEHIDKVLQIQMEKAE